MRELKSKKTIIGANASKCWNRRKKNGKMMNGILKAKASSIPRTSAPLPIINTYKDVIFVKRNFITVVVLFSLIFVLISCSLSVNVSIPPFELDFELKPVAAGLNAAEREALPGLEQAQMHWSRVDTKGRSIRDLNLTMEVLLASEEVMVFDDFDFELYLHQEGFEEDFWFHSGTISPATDTYTWNLNRDNSPAVNQLVNLINENSETDLVFLFRHNYGQGAAENNRIEPYGNIDIIINITGVAEVAIF